MMASRLVIALLLVAVSLPSLSAQPIRLGITLESGNVLNFHDDQFTGLMADAATCVMNNIPASFVVTKAPFARLLKMLENGSVDAITPFVRVESRDRYATFAGPLWPVNMRIVYPAEVSNLQAPEFIEMVKRQGYVSKRGTYIQSVIPRVLGVSEEDLQLSNHQVSTWNDALAMIKRKRGVITIVPETIIDNATPESLAGLNTQQSVGLNASFYVSNAKEELHTPFKLAVSQCRLSSAAKIQPDSRVS